MLDKVFLPIQLDRFSWPWKLTVATETMNVASLVIISNSLSALQIFLTLDIGNIVVPGCFSAKD
jgi:hypothetical protein